MDWSLTGSFLNLFEWALMMSAATAGGWLMAAHLFRLRPLERPYAGLTIALLLLALAANFLALVLPLRAAFWAAALVVLAMGIWATWRGNPGMRGKPILQRLPFNDFAIWRDRMALWLGLGSVAIFALFLSINRGLALFDDYSNLSLVSMIASGDVPPHFYLDPTRVLDYHYGTHLLAAGLVRVGGLYPWSALDIFKSLAITLALALGILWSRRWVKQASVLWAAVLFLLFAGGSRWLLLLLPVSAQQALGERVELVGSAMQTARNLHEALLGPWRIEGDGPFPFMFAFISGVARPLTLAMGSAGALPLATLFLLLLLARRKPSPAQALLFGSLLAALSLISDHLFALVYGGLVLAGVAHLLWPWFEQMRLKRQWLKVRLGRKAGSFNGDVLRLMWLLLPGALLVPAMGGTISHLLERVLRGPQAVSEGSIGLPGIALRWPPAVYSAHLGALSLAEPAHWPLILVELGPMLLLAPWAMLLAWRSIRRGRLLVAGLGIMGIVSFLVPLFLRFLERERDITRLTGAALTLWMVAGLPYALRVLQRGSPRLRMAVLVGLIVAVTGGVALFPAQLIAGSQSQPSYFVQSPDVLMARSYWNRLEPGAWVLDPAFPFRPAVLFARTTGPSHVNVYVSMPEYDALVAALDPQQIADSGYSYLYLDRQSWQKLSAEQQEGFKRGCIEMIDETKDKFGDFRRLYSLAQCKR